MSSETRRLEEIESELKMQSAYIVKLERRIDVQSAAIGQMIRRLDAIETHPALSVPPVAAGEGKVEQGQHSRDAGGGEG